MTTNSSQAIKIFLCYAREDEILCQNLEKQLRVLKRQGLIDVWYDRQIHAGAKWEKEIYEHLNAAQIILLLISPDFVASDYCYSTEMIHAMDRHQRGEAQVIPIILRPTLWQGTPFGKLQALPTDAIPVVSEQWHNQDEAFFNIAAGISRVVYKLLELPELQNSQPLTEGQIHLQMGKEALMLGNYHLAYRELKLAREEIKQQAYPWEASQACFLLALALLKGMPPSTQGLSALEYIEELLSGAINLCRSASYLKAFALLKQDIFLYIAYTHRMPEIYSLLRQSESLSWTVQDEENFRILRQCQPYLKYE